MPGKPALLFENIKGYTKPKIAMNVHGSWANFALALGMPKDTTVTAAGAAFGVDRVNNPGSHRLILASAPEGNRLAIGDEEAVALWDPTPGRERQLARVPILAGAGSGERPLAWSPNGRGVGVLDWRQAVTRLWDPPAGQVGPPWGRAGRAAEAGAARSATGPGFSVG